MLQPSKQIKVAALARILALAIAAASTAGPAAAWPFGSGAVEMTGPSLYKARCGGCHALDHNKYGPSHEGVFGRPAGTQPGYRYSKALAASGIVWTEAALDRWLADPQAMVPGTRMTERFANPQERRLIIAYLKGDPRSR
jgi:cytochrome c